VSVERSNYFPALYSSKAKDQLAKFGNNLPKHWQLNPAIYSYGIEKEDKQEREVG
jgi:hypothetical protein